MVYKPSLKKLEILKNAYDVALDLCVQNGEAEGFFVEIKACFEQVLDESMVVMRDYLVNECNKKSHQLTDFDLFYFMARMNKIFNKKNWEKYCRFVDNEVKISQKERMPFYEQFRIEAGAFLHSMQQLSSIPGIDKNDEDIIHKILSPYTNQFCFYYISNHIKYSVCDTPLIIAALSENKVDKLLIAKIQSALDEAHLDMHVCIKTAYTDNACEKLLSDGAEPVF